MGNHFFSLLALLGVITLCLGTADRSSVESSVSSSGPLPTIPHRINTTSVRKIRDDSPGKNVTDQTVPATEEMLVSSSRLMQVQAIDSVTSNEDNSSKIQKIRKKVLVSNLKNSNEKGVLQIDKLNSNTNATDEGIETENSSESGEIENLHVQSETSTETADTGRNRTAPENSRNGRRDDVIEGRNFRGGSYQGNATTNSKIKMKIPSNPPEQSTNHHTYEPFKEPQKMLSNNHLSNNEGYEEIVRTMSSAVLPSKKSTSLSRDDSLKAAAKFGAAGQTEWVPIVPGRLPLKPTPSSSQELANHLSSLVSDGGNKTGERQPIAYPSNGMKSQRESNVIPVRDADTEMTIRRRNSIGKPSSEEMKQSSAATDSMKFPMKFRSPVPYKSNILNSTVENDNLVKLRKSNLSMKYSEMEIPATGATWTLTTLKGPDSSKTTEKPIESRESVQNVANQTKKSHGGVDDRVIVPPGHIKIENVTKEQDQSLKNHVPTSSGIVNFGFNETEMETAMPKLVDVWKALKGGQLFNETDVIIPGSVDMNQRANSTHPLEVPKVSTTEMEPTSAYAATENVTTVNAQEKSNFQRASSSTSPAPGAADLSSQKFSDDMSNEKPNTLPVSIWDVGLEGTTASDAAITLMPRGVQAISTDDIILLTTPKAGSAEEMGGDDGETFTEIEHDLSKGFQNSTESFGTTFSVATQRDSPDSDRTSSEIFDTPVRVKATTVATTSNIPEKDKKTVTSINATDGAVRIPTSTLTKTPVSEVTTMNVITTPMPTTKTTAKKSSTPAATEPTFLINSATQRDAESSSVTSLPATTRFIKTTPAGSSSIRSTAFTTRSTTLSARSPSATITSPPSTTVFSSEGFDGKVKQETTEESIYYKNYVPVTPNPRDEITEENVPAYLRLTVQTSSWMELCSSKEALRDAIMRMLSEQNITSEAIHFLNLSDRNCQVKIEENGGTKPNGSLFLPVNMFLMDEHGGFDKNMSEAFLTLWGRHGLDFDLPIRKVDFVTPIINLTELSDSPLGGSVVAAIVISCVAGICVILLGILFVIMKRRQKRFNYGQRCTPVSLDAYSLDSVSIYNSVRRKGVRASKRSYGNAAFDDPEVPTHPMNFAGLANFSSAKEQLYEEFNVIPQVYPKVEELPEGAETKNRYANVIPLPETRVHLTIKEGDPLSDYINANYVRGPKAAEKLYIACQAPMESTIGDFWRMVWEQQCKVILMITGLQENGIEKCADYLPPNEVTDNLRLFGDFQVTLKKRDVKEKYIISHLNLKNMEANLWREVTHLWYLGWPDQGVPSEANSLIAFLIEARSQMKIQNGATTTSPAVVHCSPGTGRTGTVIACDLCIREYEQNRLVDIPKCVFNIRRDRAGAVQTKDQYAFIYQVLNVYATKLTGGGIESI